MKRARLIWLVAALALVTFEGTTDAQNEIVIRVTPDHLPAQPNQQATVEIVVDMPTKASSGTDDRPVPYDLHEPTLSVVSSSGTLTAQGDMTLTRDGSGTRARGSYRMTFTTAADARPGDVLITVEATQAMTLLGVKQAGPDGEIPPTFRGGVRLFLDALPGGPTPAGPVTQPLGTPTEGGVNPPDEIIKRLVPIVLILGPITLGTWLSSRGKRPRVEPQPGVPVHEAPPQAPPPTPPPAGPRVTQVVTAPPPPKERERVDPKKIAQIVLTATPDLVDADETTPIFLRLEVVCPKGVSATITNARYSATHRASEYHPRLPHRASQGTFKPIWEWEEKQIAFSVTCTVTLELTAGVFLDGSTTASIPRETTSNTVTLRGATPEVTLEPVSEALLATGRNGTEFHTHLFLFKRDQPETAETFTLRRVSGTTAGPAMEGKLKDIVTDADSSGGDKDARPAPLKQWVAPFLLQEKGYAEQAGLHVDVEWSGGVNWELAKPVPPQYRLLAGDCEVTLRGCTAWTRAGQSTFLPRKGAALEAIGGIMDADGFAIGSPLEADAVHSSSAKVTCTISDFSQGRPTCGVCSQPLPCGCGDKHVKLPPKHLLDGIEPPKDPEARSKWLTNIVWSHREVIVSPADRPVALSKAGEFVSPRKSVLEICQWTPREGQDAIHNGPLVYLLKVDDGIGGIQEIGDLFCAQLGSLVLETGGPEFRVYEYRPHLFRASYSPPIEDLTGPGDEPVTVQWSFMCITPGAATAPAGGVAPGLRYAGRVETQGAAADALALVTGHTPSHRRVSLNRDTGDIRSVSLAAQASEERLKAFGFPRGSAEPPGNWIAIDDAARQRSLTLRQACHAVPADYRIQEMGLQWLPQHDWVDDTLALAIRAEMRDAKGNLVATSDRLQGAARTPPDLVWTDHRFIYVLLALRLRLRDDTDDPYALKPFRLQIDDGPIEDGKTTINGAIERVIPPPAERGRLTFGGKDENASVFELSLGTLDPVEEPRGLAARLNNLGLAAATSLDDIDDDQLRRAIDRFRSRRNIEVPANFDNTGMDVVRKAVVEAHEVEKREPDHIIEDEAPR